MNLQGKRVLVTGGGSGIGLALVQAFTERGAVVVTCGRRLDKLNEARARLPTLVTFQADLSTAEGVRAVLSRPELGPLDVLVNNAGAMRTLDLRQPADAGADEQELFVNLVAPVLLTRALVPQLLTRPEAAVVNVTSGAALVPMTGAPLYSAAKAAMRSFSRSLRRQLSGTSVRVLEAAPPLVDTDMPRALSGTGARMKRMSPEACARFIVEAVAADRAELLLGANAMLKWADRFFPGVAEAQMARL